LRRIWFGGWVRKQLCEADAVISLNAEMTEELLMAGIASDRIRHIPNGVDCKQFLPPSQGQRQQARSTLSIGPDDIVVLYAGRLAVDTGTAFLLDAWRRLEAQFPGELWTLIIAGDELGADVYRSRGQRELRRARFVGKVADVRPLLRATDLVVRPSLNEGMSNLVLEAMASGLPVVGTRTGGLNEQVEDGVTGLLVTPADAEALAEAMLTLMRDQGRRLSMGSAARVRAEERYSIDAIVDAYETLYAGLTVASRTASI